MSITPDEFIRRDPFDEWVPTYTEHDEQSLQPWIDGVSARSDDLGLPLTHYPGVSRGGSYIPGEFSFPGSEPHDTQAGIITSFFSAVRSKNTEVVTAMVSSGLVSPDATDDKGTTPLIAAIEAGNATMVRTLVGLGAEVDSMASFSGRIRTPLMVAASRGNLVLVKLLMETYRADDAVIAPDGQIALRLAASGGHAEVVDYLPLRRGGEWRRWQAHHEVAMRRVRAACKGIFFFGACIFWYLPKFVLWWLPKHCVVLPARDAAVWTWGQRGRVGRWCKRQAKEFPGRCSSAAKGVWKGVKAVPKAAWKGVKAVPKAVSRVSKEVLEILKGVWKVLKAVPGIVRDVAKWLWGVVKSIPAALKIVGGWIWTSLKKMGGAAASAFARVFALLHTAVSAVVSFFRAITLKDVLNAVGAVLQAIFVDFPKAVWSSVKAFGDISYKVMKTLFGLLGAIVWWIARGIIWVVTYVPMEIGVILARIGGSIAKGFKEIMIWINPKAKI